MHAGLADAFLGDLRASREFPDGDAVATHRETELLPRPLPGLAEPLLNSPAAAETRGTHGGRVPLLRVKQHATSVVSTACLWARFSPGG